MPKLMNVADTSVLQTVSQFGFTAQNIDTLGSSEYTLVSIAIDVSGSVSGFRAELEKAYRSIIESCRKNPRAENLLIRGVKFNTSLDEIHGFNALTNIDENSVKFSPVGGTALYDSALEGIESVSTYATKLTDMDYFVNGVVFVVTDGEENSSVTANLDKIRDTLERIRKDEKLESIKVILIGVGNDSSVKSYLDNFSTTVGIDQYVHINNTDAKGIAKLADFISRSISSSSQSLGSGGPSENLTV